jgi:hypothetical protein
LFVHQIKPTHNIDIRRAEPDRYEAFRLGMEYSKLYRYELIDSDLSIPESRETFWLPMYKWETIDATDFKLLEGGSIKNKNKLKYNQLKKIIC